MAKKAGIKTSKNGQQVDVAASSLDDDEHAKLLRWVNESDDGTVDSREVSEKCRRYYDSDQLDTSERKRLKQNKQPAVVINRCKPKMDSLMGLEKAAKTTAKAFPRTPKHEKGAEASTEAIRFVLQDNAFDQTRSACWENILIEGTCGAEIIVKPQGDGDYKIVINHLMWDRLIYDAYCRSKSFDPRTCRYLGQVVWMDYDEALAKYPNAEDVLENMQAGSSTYEDQPKWMDNTRKRVKIVELYYRRADGEMWYACFTYGGYCEAPKKSPYINEEKETEWPYEFASAFVTREGGRYGAMMQLLDVQDEINKRRSKALHLMSVRQVRGERGAVEDVNKARQELARPDGYVETTPGMEFEILKTGDMATGQWNMLTEAKEEIDAVGANAAVQGKDTSVQSGVALRECKMAGQTEIGPMFDVLRYWQHRVFRKVWNRIHQYWKAEKWIRVTDDDINLRWVGLNKPVTLGEQMMQQAQEQGEPPEALAQMKQQIMQDPAMQKVVSTENDIVNLDMDIIVEEVPDVLTAQIEDFQTLGEMVKSGFQMPPLAVIEASPLSNKDKIIKMMKEEMPPSPKVQQQIDQMQEQLQKVTEDAQKLTEENQTLKSGQQEAAMKIQASQAESQAKLDARRQEMGAEFQLKQEEQAGELRLERERANNKMALERDIANQKLALAKETEARDQETTLRKAALDAAVKIALGSMDAEARSAEADAAKSEAKAEEKTAEKAAPDISGIMEKILSTQADLLKTLSAPKQVMRDASGKVTGLQIVQ